MRHRNRTSAGCGSAECWADRLRRIKGKQRIRRGEALPFGVRTMLVETAFFFSELPSESSAGYAALSLGDYVDLTLQIVAVWAGMGGK